MASVLVRDLDPAVVDRLKARAEENGRSLAKGAKGDPRNRGSAGDLGGSAGEYRARAQAVRRASIL